MRFTSPLLTHVPAFCADSAALVAVSRWRPHGNSCHHRAARFLSKVAVCTAARLQLREMFVS